MRYLGAKGRTSHLLSEWLRKKLYTHTHHTHNDKANEQNVNNWWTRVPFIILATVYKFSIVANILIF